MIDFALTDEQEMLRDMCVKFVKNEIIPVAAKHDRDASFPYEIAAKVLRAGLLYPEIPMAYGGSGLTILETTIVVEEFGYGCAGISQFLTGNCLAGVPIGLFGNDEQKSRHWVPLCESSEPRFTAFCLTEPNAGSDNSSMETTAVRNGDKYVINGRKCFITNGGVASLYTVYATVDRSKGYKGITGFIVPRKEGIHIGKKEDKLGQRAGNVTDVIFENVEVPIEDRIGKEGDGFIGLLTTLDHSRPIAGALAIGVARRAFDEAKRYCSERIQFGKSISSNQAIQFCFADMYADILAGRLLNWHAAWLSTEGKKNIKESAMAKAFCSDVGMRVTTQCLQLFGGYGYMRDYPMEKLFRDSKLIQIYEGTNEIQRWVAGRAIFR